MRTRWDIFCKVIDNYGDIGVAWRLARLLASEHGLAVRLWVDDLAAFRRIWPASAAADQQLCEGVTICAWCSPFPAAAPAEVVIEAFGCALPETYLLAMSEQSPPPVWINLEYLSAESWVESHHGLPSPHPQLPLTKYFFFPGYTSRTGGLLAEAGLAARRDRARRESQDAFRRAHGVTRAEEWLVSLFAYENPLLPDLLDAWAADARPLTCLVPEGRILPQLAAWLGVATLGAGASHRRGALRLQVLPFVDQDAYDRLLWASDLNFVRGEDSCVRAQWAARPLVWQAYPQAGAAHGDKLDALLTHYTRGLDEVTAGAIGGLWWRWNGMPQPGTLAADWAAWRACAPAISAHAHAWCEHLAMAGRLSDKLVVFVENKIK